MKKRKSKRSVMKAYETFDLWLVDQKAKHQKLIKALRNLVNETSPSLSEAVKWGNGCWVGEEWPVIFIFGGYDILQFGFFGGAELSDADTKKLLRGKGKFVRHIPIQSLQDIDQVAFKKLIKKAIKNEREG